MLHRRMIVMPIVLAMAIVLAACIGPSETAEPTTIETKRPVASVALDDTEWVLVSLNDSSLIEGTNITLNFAEGILSGFAGCNAYGGGRDSGKYAATDEGTLTISQLAVTVQLCPTPEGVMQQEAAYIEALRNVATYRLMDDRLEMDNAAGETTLVFARKEEFAVNPDDLLGTAWQLASMNGSNLIEGSTTTLAFHNEYRVSGRAGCRGYIATYEASGDDIHFPWIAMIGEACLDQDALTSAGLSTRLEQEGQYTTSLEWATNYHLSEERLEIFTARDEVLVFKPLPEDADASLEGTTWALTAFIEEKTVEGMPTPLPMLTDLLAATEITATLEDGTMSGSAGCNTYSTAYTFDSSFLTLGTPAATEMACSAPLRQAQDTAAGIMEQEQRYLEFLENVTAYRIHSNQLWLETGDGRALVFTAPERRDCTGPNAFPTEEAELIWPELREVQPDQVAPGDEVRILGVGGYLYWDNECGEFWLESARDFQLFFGGKPASSITCYANLCVTNLTVPTDALPGTHVISVEGGSSLSIGVSGKPTLSPTPTPSPVPTNTSTPQPTTTEEANVGPVIHYLRANVEEADPGDTIVLEWESSGGTAAILYHVAPSGQLPQSGWEVAPSGVYAYQIPPDARNFSEFFLYVYDDPERGAGANLAVRLRCPVPWFFEPAPDVCASDPILSNAAEQHFERGTMIWVEEKGRIFVLYDDDQYSPKWEMFTDQWDEGEPDHDPALTPPAGLYQPVRGFGLVWRERPQVRDRLGWAVDQETGFSTIMQSTTRFKYNSIYLRALDGNVWHLGPERSSWEKMGERKAISKKRGRK